LRIELENGYQRGESAVIRSKKSKNQKSGFYYIFIKLVDCLEKCLIYGHIRRFAD